MSKSFKFFIVFIMCYASFQYGRVHDEGVEVYQPEYNHIVITDRCEVVLDTLGNINTVWYRDVPYVYSPELLENL